MSSRSPECNGIDVLISLGFFESSTTHFVLLAERIQCNRVKDLCNDFVESLQLLQC